MKKNLSDCSMLMLVIMMIMMLLSACTPNAENKDFHDQSMGNTTTQAIIPDSETKTIRLLSYDALSSEMLSNLSDKLNKQGLNVEVEATRVTMDGTTTSVLNSYNSGLPSMDIALFADYSIMVQMYEKGLIQDIEDYADMFPQLFYKLPENGLAAASFGDALLGYPLLESSGVKAVESSVMIRGDIMDKLGAELPESPEELLELCIMARDAGLPCELVIDGTPPYAFHRTYAEWPFYVDNNSLVLILSNGDVEAYAGSDVFARDAALYGRFQEERVLRSLYFHNERQEFQKDNQALACIYPASFSNNFEYKDELLLVQFAPEVGNINTTPVAKRFLSISTACEDPIVALQFLEVVYSNQSVYNALVYGIEDIDWNYDTDGKVKVINGNGWYFNTAAWEQYRAKTQNQLNTYLGEDTVLSFNPGAYNFALDIEQVNKIFTSKGFAYPDSGMFFIRDGSISMDFLSQAVEAMRQAGLDNVVERYKEQYDLYDTNR